ncbi:hypothetical protein AVEN_127737-1 [Araneus ventricosus]|uniref:Uncharacterized protein n=1 Tax=Araneus ventricosus TaxID=182803 RepID=A0A4Y2EFX4_ARAVE|nr:hypothetical protein AVEN_127737-1 [Araneus ventricosus]
MFSTDLIQSVAQSAAMVRGQHGSFSVRFPVTESHTLQKTYDGPPTFEFGLNFDHVRNIADITIAQILFISLHEYVSSRTSIPTKEKTNDTPLSDYVQNLIEIYDFGLRTT